MTTSAPTTDLRWSSVRDCPRKAIYRETGAPARDWTDREERIMFRGVAVGRDYADWLERQHGEGNVLREVEIPWELGVGHADAYVTTIRTLFEVVSTANPSAALIDGKVLQLTGYLEHFPEADAGCVVAVNPTDFTEERFPISRNAKAYPRLVGEMRARIEQVKRWRDTGEIPPRVCDKPTDAIGHFCVYANHCFDGWDPPALEEIDDERNRHLAVSYFYAKKTELAAAAVAKRATDERKALEESLALTIPEGKWRVGPLALTRKHIVRSPTFDLKKAELAGLPIHEDFLKPGSEYDTWRVDRVTDEPLPAPDYGDVPF